MNSVLKLPFPSEHLKKIQCLPNPPKSKHGFSWHSPDFSPELMSCNSQPGCCQSCSTTPHYHNQHDSKVQSTVVQFLSEVGGGLLWTFWNKSVIRGRQVTSDSRQNCAGTKSLYKQNFQNRLNLLNIQVVNRCLKVLSVCGNSPNLKACQGSSIITHIKYPPKIPNLHNLDMKFSEDILHAR